MTFNVSFSLSVLDMFHIALAILGRVPRLKMVRHNRVTVVFTCRGLSYMYCVHSDRFLDADSKWIHKHVL